jgi:hypothetical protein
MGFLEALQDVKKVIGGVQFQLLCFTKVGGGQYLIIADLRVGSGHLYLLPRKQNILLGMKQESNRTTFTPVRVIVLEVTQTSSAAIRQKSAGNSVSSYQKYNPPAWVRKRGSTVC